MDVLFFGTATSLQKANHQIDKLDQAIVVVFASSALL
jgi:hypothetical protein